MRSFEHPNEPRRAAVAVTRDCRSRQPARWEAAVEVVPFRNFDHRPRRLAGREYNQPTRSGRRRKMRRQTRGRMRRRHRGTEQIFQKMPDGLHRTDFQPVYSLRLANAPAQHYVIGTIGESTMDDKTRTELEAAAFRRLIDHLRSRTDVQNIDLMNLAGFCRNCLSNWMKEAADQNGVSMSKDESREAVYGMPYDEWRAKYQKEASPDQKAAFDKGAHRH
jgi:hypothetical protein